MTVVSDITPTKRISVEHIGTVGALMRAFDEGIITDEEILETLDG